MKSALAGCRLEITSPRSRDVRAGDEVALEVSLEVADPWIERPRWGREIRGVDGAGLTGLAFAFACDRPTPVTALISGTVQGRDTRIDVHTPPGFPDAGAGRGHELVLSGASGITVRYGHLARGSTRTGQVKVGETIGTSGNTGRCVDGCGKTFVHVELEGARLARSLDELAQPIELELLVAGRPGGSPVRLPSGETSVSRLRVGSVRVPRDQGQDAIEVEVRAVRRRTTLAAARTELRVRV
jgi:hypothetical protein